MAIGGGLGSLTGEALDPVITKYYTFNGKRVAMRTVVGGTDTLVMLHGDHLGSASLTTDAAGNVVGDRRYYPYGDTRSGTMSTDRRFTGQREETAIGLYDYKARYYDPVIGRLPIRSSRSRGTRRRSTGMRMS